MRHGTLARCAASPEPIAQIPGEACGSTSRVATMQPPPMAVARIAPARTRLNAIDQGRDKHP
jgi:hypothetical protein